VGERGVSGVLGPPPPLPHTHAHLDLASLTAANKELTQHWIMIIVAETWMRGLHLAEAAMHSPDRSANSSQKSFQVHISCMLMALPGVMKFSARRQKAWGGGGGFEPYQTGEMATVSWRVIMTTI